MTKIMFSLVTLAFVAGTLSAQENLLKNGGFEQIVKKTKSGDRYIQEKIKAKNPTYFCVITVDKG